MRIGWEILRNFLNLIRSRTQEDLPLSPYELATNPTDAHARDADDERRKAISQADELWQSGETSLAFQVLRQVRLEFGPTPALQFEYGRKAYEKGFCWAAR